MGIKFSWKKIIVIVSICLGIPSAIITIAKGWDVVLDILIFVKNVVLGIPRFLVGNIGRDIILLVLIGILFWLFRRKWKARRITPQPERFHGGQDREDWQYDWNSKHECALKIVAESEFSIRYEDIFAAFEKKFPKSSKLDFRVIFDQLDDADLIKFTSYDISGKKCFKATKKGREYSVKGLLAEMERKKIASQF